MRIRTVNRSFLFAGVALLPALCLSPLATADMTFPGEPVPLAQAAGKPGAVRVTLPERSPLSAPAAAAKEAQKLLKEIDGK